MSSEIMIQYEHELPVAMEACNIRNLSLHNHPDTIELIYVLSGEAEMKVSFENFSLKPGDFLVVNHQDFHYIKGKGEDNAVLSLFICLPWLEERIRHVRYITFACESFMIQDHRCEHVEKLRSLICGIAADLTLRSSGYQTDASEKVLQLMSILVDHFTILQYYSSGQKLNSRKIDKYYSIMKKLEEDYQNKSLLDEISKSEFYSKFYLAHLYKGMMMSIQDAISGMRCFQSEKMLLTTNESVQTIALEYGFSDAKYYYKHFRKWYGCTPAKFRKQYQPEVYRDTVTVKVSREELLQLIRKDQTLTAAGAGKWRLLSSELGSGSEPELSAFAALDLFGRFLPSGSITEEHEKADWNGVDKVIRSLQEAGYCPRIEMDFSDRSEDDWLQVLIQFGKKYERELGSWEFCFYYEDANQTECLRSMIAEVRSAIPDIAIKAVFRWT